MFKDDIGNFVDTFVDTLGDICGKSQFFYEKKAWNYLLGADLTRALYNQHKDEMQFRNAVVYDDMHGHRFLLGEVMETDYFDYDGTPEKDRQIEEKNSGESILQSRMLEKANQYGVPVRNRHYMMGS